MGNKTVVRTGKMLFILLLTFFLISVTAAAVSANMDISKFGPIDKKNYMNGYNKGFHDGSIAGYTAGMKDGYNDSQKGLDNKSGSGGKSNLATRSSYAFDLGYTDGFNNGYRQGHSAGYEAGDNSYHHQQKSGNHKKPN
jgi:flagellar biosynthesis/type III secretory pathway protein FliH